MGGSTLATFLKRRELSLMDVADGAGPLGAPTSVSLLRERLLDSSESVWCPLATMLVHARPPVVT